jgi:hypothetical protein
VGKRGALGASLAGAAALAAVLLLIARKGPAGALVAVLAAAVLVGILTVVTELLKKR